ncbi:MAG TPA: response regulator [Spirochaetota bacterium]|nr:response regulator [Spirochaetota bacterium]HPJ44278.1 response regulator [Spirochaetota bacterium]HPR39325.1 response regulator [Spirochaetota bacterium]HRX49680.1 response regulator [Spirochaetota bacterium]
MAEGVAASEKTILIVEDSPTQMKELKRILETGGYNVKTAGNGNDALSFLYNNRPDIIITDIIMPEMDGYELCRKIKSHDKLKGIPVILLTVLSEPADILKGLSCGADNFVTKPYHEEYLLSRIEYITLNLEARRSGIGETGVELVFSGRKMNITSPKIQILDLLISAYDTVIQKNRELEAANRKLREANEKIKTLSGLLPICSVCKKIRNDTGYWDSLEKFFAEHIDISFSHGYCPDCAKKILDEIKKR